MRNSSALVNISWSHWVFVWISWPAQATLSLHLCRYVEWKPPLSSAKHDECLRNKGWSQEKLQLHGIAAPVSRVSRTLHSQVGRECTCTTSCSFVPLDVGCNYWVSLSFKMSSLPSLPRGKHLPSGDEHEKLDDWLDFRLGLSHFNALWLFKTLGKPLLSLIFLDISLSQWSSKDINCRSFNFIMLQAAAWTWDQCHAEYVAFSKSNVIIDDPADCWGLAG